MYPFTSSQWRELEQQALVFKYLSYNLPIPSDLISQIKQSFLLSLSIGPSPATFPSLSPPDAWGYLQTGFGRRREDLQPGRCRRTDGKKWRCSKETTGDSKYCERHMHRGKNRSRKLVELSLATTCTPNVHHNQYQPAFSPYKNPNPVENENNHKDDGENGFWFLSESNDLKIEKVALDLSEKPRAFHCFFD